MALSSSSRAPKRPLHFLDLPSEVQREIISHCDTRDLICVALVSRHFRELAAAELYRTFAITIPHPDDPGPECIIDPLAGGLDTLVTSSYNYAQYLRTFVLDTPHVGEKAEKAVAPYTATVTCGKFMNTLLLLALRNARALETFK